MQVKVQVVTITDEGQEITREVACVERYDLTPVTLGLSLAELLPERTTPELLFLESKWAALVAYGLSVKLLQDVLPIDKPLHAVTIRNHVFTLAQRLEDSLGEEQGCSIEGCSRDWGCLPIPDGPLAEHLLDWFHLTMRLTTMTQRHRPPKGYPP